MTMRQKADLIIALDTPTVALAWEIVEKLNGLPVIFKVGSELFLHEGPAFVREMVHRKHRVFLDLKFHDIPNTVAAAVRQATLMQVEMLTVHMSGGASMFKAIREALAEVPTLRPKLLGVTVLTSFDDLSWAEVAKAGGGHAFPVIQSVRAFTDLASQWGADGVVCSPWELPQVRTEHPSLYTVVPGIRPKGTPMGDQSRVMTPREASDAGASAIVVGRPILQSPDPRRTAEEILNSL